MTSGHGLWWAMAWLTEPSRSPAKPPRPRLPTTSIVAPRSCCHQGVGRPAFLKAASDLDLVTELGGGQCSLDDLSLHLLDLGGQIERVQRDVAQIGSGWHIGGGEAGNHLDHSLAVVGLFNGPDQGLARVSGALNPDDDASLGLVTHQALLGWLPSTSVGQRRRS